MIKKNITPQQMVDFLNELLITDRRTIENLFGSRVVCNKKLAKHPTVQVMAYGTKKGFYMVGLIGLLNGMFGADKDGWGCISMDLKGSKLTKFTLLKDRM